MRLTPGEKRALPCLALILIGFLPPVTGWAATVETRVLGMPFLLFWNAAMVLATAFLMNLASVIKKKADGK